MIYLCLGGHCLNGLLFSFSCLRIQVRIQEFVLEGTPCIGKESGDRL